MTTPRLDFDGATYQRDLDQGRLEKQLDRVRAYMLSVEWVTPAEIEAATGYNWASISARLRDLRKQKFGGYQVDRKRVGGGLFAYRVVKGRLWYE